MSAFATHSIGVIRMAVGVFIEKRHRPEMKEMLASINSKKGLWNDLERFLEENYRTKRDFAFYGKNYGWAVRFRKAGKALLSAYPEEDAFTVQIILSQTLAEKASSLKLGKNAKKVLENAHPFPEGRWLFIKVNSSEDISDIKQLILLKERPKTSP
jgi:hypothetical protein